MLCSSSDQNLIEKIQSLNAKGVEKFLREEDEKYVVWKQTQMLERIPKELQPNEKIEHQITSPFLNTIVKSRINQSSKYGENKFPTLFFEKVIKNDNFFTYDENSIAKSMMNIGIGKDLGQLKGDLSQKSLINHKSDKLSSSENKFDQQLVNQLVSKTEIESKQQMGLQKDPEDQNKVSSRIQEEKVEQKQLIDQDGGKRFISFLEKTVLPSQGNSAQKEADKLGNLLSVEMVKKYSPFVSNQKNFFDSHANSKNNDKFSFIDPKMMARNMLHFAHTQKKPAFSNEVLYTNSLVKGNTENPFKKRQMNTQKIEKGQFKDNIESVLRYTLNDPKSRGKSMNIGSHTQPRKMENPFVRAPKRFI